MSTDLSADTDSRLAWVAVPSVDSSLATKLLPAVLSVTAGSVDSISFLGLGGLFAAHITGNLVIMASHIVTGGHARLPQLLSLPVFIGMLGLTRILAAGLEALQVRSLGPLLLLQFLLLAAFLGLCVTDTAPLDVEAPHSVLAGMMGVAAMAVQNALVQVSLEGAPSTAVMTSNLTRIVADLGTILLGCDPRDVRRARDRARHTWQAILGFAAGCGLGASCLAWFGIWALLFPTGAALIAVGLGFAASTERGAPC